MKTFYISVFSFIIIFTLRGLSQQKYYTFSELRGMDDSLTNTHLFYRLYYDNYIPNYEELSDNMYHWDLSANIDTLFLSTYYYENPAWQGGSGVGQVEFWNNDPSKYIYIYTSCGIDCDGGITRYDGNGMQFGLDLPQSIGISRQNDSIVYAGTSVRTFKSTNGGKSFDVINDTVRFYSLNPYLDNVLFGGNYGHLAKSTNGGDSFKVYGNFSFSNSVPEILYDKDTLHIYLLYWDTLYVSSDWGNTWENKFQVSPLGNSPPYISIDESKSGVIYFAYMNNIYYSKNYGENFSLFKTLNQDVVGIYKKPESDIIYAATTFKLLEIKGDSVKILKRLPLSPSILNFFPLAKGDKWIYKERSTIIPEGDMFYGTKILEVTGDTVMPDSEEYKIISDGQGFRYLRADSIGRVLEYDPFNFPDSANKATLYFDLSMDREDTVNSDWMGYNGKLVFSQDGKTNAMGINTTYRNYIFNSGTYRSEYQLINGIGIYTINSGHDFVLTDDTLKGAIINGIVYGDTTVTEVKNTNAAPAKFELYQNYPNPFNPVTTIRYEIPKGSRVTIKIFDVLGREVETLCNEEQNAGMHEVKWDGNNFSSGVYFYRIAIHPDNITAGDFVSVKKMLLIK